MTIDTERLASDPGYWDELKAPEDATHACIYLGGKWQWMRANLSGPFNYYWHQRFSEWQRQESEVGERIIPRPQKPEVERDGKGLPPVGHEFEIDVKTAIDWHAGDAWRQCEVLAHRGGKAICWVPTCNSVVSTSNAEHFRRIRTKEQRQRDDAVREAAHAIEMKNGSPVTLYLKYCEDLYDAGLLRLEPKDA